MNCTNRDQHCRAFTLLELVFALMILALLVGVGFAGMNHIWKGEEVESSARKMQTVMMRALRLSVANQRPYAVVLEPTRLRLIEAKDVMLAENADGDSEVPSIEQAVIAPGVEVFIMRWQQEKWKAVELEVLDFPVSGICEPVRFRLVNEVGSSGADVLEFSLHPLTAFPVDETLLVQ